MNAQIKTVQNENFPAELCSRPQWVTWRFQRRKGEHKPTKVPYDSHTGEMAQSNDSATWGSLEDALKACERRGHDGVGLMFSAADPYCGIDLDDCLNAATGEINPWAQGVVDRFVGCYVEASPSGKGVHIICKGKLPEGGRNPPHVEMYDSVRYFTMSGTVLGETPDKIADCQEALEALHTEVFGKKLEPNVQRSVQPVSMDDAELIEKAMAAKNGAKFAALWNGDFTGYPSQSEADQALCHHLVFYTGRDSVRMDSLFRQSGLYRQKWDEKRRSDGQTYGQRTIQNSVENCTEVYTPKATKYEQNGRQGQSKSDSLSPQKSFSQTDDGNAERLVFRHGGDLRYCFEVGWVVYDGKRWTEDKTGGVRRRCVETVKNIGSEATNESDPEKAAALLKWAGRCLSDAKIKAMVSSAESKLPFPVLFSEFDTDPSSTV